MEIDETVCSDCGAVLGAAARAGERFPCPACGSHRRTIRMSGTVVVKAQVSASYSVVASNNAMGKRIQLEHGFAEAEKAVATNDAGLALRAVKQALEALHELSDCEQAGEWSTAPWSAPDNDLFSAHLAARHAAHHRTHAPVALRSEPEDERRLRWELTSADVALNRGSRGVAQFAALLEGNAVIPPLRVLVARIAQDVQ